MRKRGTRQSLAYASGWDVSAQRAEPHFSVERFSEPLRSQRVVIRTLPCGKFIKTKSKRGTRQSLAYASGWDVSARRAEPHFSVERFSEPLRSQRVVIRTLPRGKFIKTKSKRGTRQSLAYASGWDVSARRAEPHFSVERFSEPLRSTFEALTPSHL